jgi:hypothetical protein
MADKKSVECFVVYFPAPNRRAASLKELAPTEGTIETESGTTGVKHGVKQGEQYTMARSNTTTTGQRQRNMLLTRSERSRYVPVL